MTSFFSIKGIYFDDILIHIHSNFSNKYWWLPISFHTCLYPKDTKKTKISIFRAKKLEIDKWAEECMTLCPEMPERVKGTNTIIRWNVMVLFAIFFNKLPIGFLLKCVPCFIDINRNMKTIYQHFKTPALSCPVSRSWPCWKKFYPTLTSKMAAFVACWALRKWRDAVIIVKVKEPLGEFTFAPLIGWKSKKPLGKCTFAGKIYFSVYGMERHKMEIKYNDNGTLSPRSMNVQR